MLAAPHWQRVRVRPGLRALLGTQVERPRSFSEYLTRPETTGGIGAFGCPDRKGRSVGAHPRLQSLFLLNAKTLILLIHGENVRIIPSVESTVAKTLLQAAGFKVKLIIETDVGHTISMTGARHGLEFLHTKLT